MTKPSRRRPSKPASSAAWLFFLEARRIARLHLDHPARRHDFVRTLVGVVAATARRAPAVIRRARAGGVHVVPPTLEAVAARALEERSRLVSARTGLAALVQLFASLPLEGQERAAQAIFHEAGLASPSRPAAASMTALLKVMRQGIEENLGQLSAGLDSSDEKLQRRARLAAFAAVFTAHRVPIAPGTNSPFVRLCERAELKRGYVTDHLPETMAEIDRHVRDVFGDKEALT